MSQSSWAGHQSAIRSGKSKEEITLGNRAGGHFHASGVPVVQPGDETQDSEFGWIAGTIGGAIRGGLVVSQSEE